MAHDESFDIASNLPVYLSRQEAEKWLMDESTSHQPFQILDDDEDDDKVSDVASSVVTVSTVGESREFWLNCLQENGVDMAASTAPLAFSSPRKNLSLTSQKTDSPLSSRSRLTRSPHHKPLTPRDPNAMYFSEDDDESEAEQLEQYQPLASGSMATEQKTPTNFSDVGHFPAFSSDDLPLSVQQGMPETNVVPFADTMRGPLPRRSAPNYRGRFYQPQIVASVPSDEFFGSRAEALIRNDNIFIAEEGNLSYDSSLGAPGDETALPISTHKIPETHSTMEERKPASWEPSTVTTVFSEEMEEPFGDETLADSSSRLAGMDVLLPPPSLDRSPLFVDESLDHSPFVDESPEKHVSRRLSISHLPVVSDTASTLTPWVPPREASPVKKEQTTEPHTSEKLREQDMTTAEVGINVQGEISNHETKSSDDVPGEAVKPADPYTWMYEVWDRKGLLVHSLEKTTNRVPLRVHTASEQVSSKKAGAVKMEPPLALTHDFPEKSSPKEEKSALTTPRDAFVTLDYEAISASEKNNSKKERMSLPANLRSSAQKQGGREEFENVMKMWRKKSDDKPNAHFLSPEQPVANTAKRQSQGAFKTRPTQHSQLLSITEQTTSTRRQSTSSTLRPPREGETITPRSQMVDDKTTYSPTKDSSATKKSPYRSTSPLDVQLQMPTRRLSSGSRRKSQPTPPSVVETVTTKPDNRRRETINPREHFSRLKSHTRSRGDYKTVVKSFLSNVEENKNHDDSARTEELDLSGINLGQDESTTASSKLEEFSFDESITPRNADTSATAHLSATRSSSKDSPWTQQMVNKLDKVPRGSGEKSWGPDDRPWRQDLVRRRVSTLGERPPVSLGQGACQCSVSVFSGNDALIDFFLPQMGMACNCGKRAMGLRDPEEPTALNNILRPWQVEFLASFGIERGDQLVKAHHRSSKALANALRQYRRKHGMTPFRTKSCGMALQIWSKTCKAYVRSIRKQLTCGTSELKVPNTLYIISSFIEKMHMQHSPMPCDHKIEYDSQAEV
jgi:hypothetical protein